MISKRTISEIRQLHQLKFRQQNGLFIAEGEKVVKELLTSDHSIRQILCLNNYDINDKNFSDQAKVSVITEAELARISLLKSPNKVLAVVQIPPEKRIDVNSKGLYVVLDGIRDPGNMGTIIRTAVWFGAKGIICSEDCVDVYNPKVVQGSMGALFHSTINYTQLPSFLESACQNKNASVIAADINGTPVSEMNADAEINFIVIGNESTGISPDVIKKANQVVRIPGGGTESLNAAVACGILLNTLYK